MIAPDIKVELQYGGGFLAWSLDAPGLTAEGDSEDEARERFLRAWRALVREHQEAAR